MLQTHSLNDNLRACCERCFGLCCTALYFSSSEGFPTDKEAGQPCPNLEQDFRCRVYANLWTSGLKGCTAFDCFGAGQKVSQDTYGGQDWRKVPESAEQMFEAFLIMRQLYEMLWYLAQALTLPAARPIHEALCAVLEETGRLTNYDPISLVSLDVPTHRTKVNTLLVKTSELVRSETRSGITVHSGRQKTWGPGAWKLGADLCAKDLRGYDLRGANLRGACLIAADLRGLDLSGTDLLGSDFRDTDIRGTDLTESIFLTQAQINTARGDDCTKLPALLKRPAHWRE